MINDIVYVPMYELTFNSLENKYQDKTTQELNNLYSKNGCICPCIEYRKTMNKLTNSKKDGRFMNMYSFKNHMKTKQHCEWIKNYNDNNCSGIESKSLSEITEMYIELQKKHRKEKADLHMAYIEQNKRMIEKYTKEILEKDEKILELTKKIEKQIINTTNVSINLIDID